MKLPAILPREFLNCLSEEDRRSLAPGQPAPEELLAKLECKSEKELQRLITAYLRLQDIEVLQMRTDKRSTATLGWPDLTFAVNGMPVAWELKKPGGKPEPHQVLMHCRMVKNGWTVDVVRSFQEARDLLKSYDI